MRSVCSDGNAGEQVVVMVVGDRSIGSSRGRRVMVEMWDCRVVVVLDNVGGFGGMIW